MLSERTNVIFGQTGSGKSRLLRRMLRDSRRLILVDTMLEHEDMAPSCSLEDLRPTVRRGGEFRRSVWPEDEEDFAWTAELAASLPSIDFAVDEYSFWYPAAQCQPCKGLLALVRCGRKLHQSVYLTTQSPGSITKQLTGQGAVWVFPMHEGRDRHYVLERTAGAIDPATLRIIEGAPPLIIRTELAVYCRGERRDYVLHTPTCEIEERKSGDSS